MLQLSRITGIYCLTGRTPSFVSCLRPGRKMKRFGFPLWSSFAGLSLLAAATLLFPELRPNTKSLPASARIAEIRCSQQLSCLTGKSVRAEVIETIGSYTAYSSRTGRFVPTICWNVQCETATERYNVLLAPDMLHIARLLRERKQDPDADAVRPPDGLLTEAEANWLGAGYLRKLGYPAGQNSLRKSEYQPRGIPSPCWELSYVWRNEQNACKSIRVQINAQDSGLDYLYSVDMDEKRKPEIRGNTEFPVAPEERLSTLSAAR